MASRLTFGVEFEFWFATLDLSSPDPNPDDKRPVTRLAQPLDRRSGPEIIAKALSDAGLPSRPEFLHEESEKTDTMWLVGVESSLLLPNRLYDWYPVEVKTPPYYYCPESLEAVKYGLHILTKNFRLHINESCGLHVHIGNGLSGFDLKTLRTLMAFLWTFEPVLCQIHPNRPFVDSGYDDMYYPPLRRETALAKTWRRPLPPNALDAENNLEDQPNRSALTVRQGLSAILQQDDIHSLTELLNTRKKLAYNIKYLREPFEHQTKRTIEFRQHEGCLDGDRVIAWIQTAAGIVGFAQGCNLVAFTELVTTHARLEDESEETYNVVDLLHDIGLDEPASFYCEVIYSELLGNIL